MANICLLYFFVTNQMKHDIVCKEKRCVNFVHFVATRQTKVRNLRKNSAVWYIVFLLKAEITLKPQQSKNAQVVEQNPSMPKKVVFFR